MATRTRRKAPAGTIQVDFSKMKEGGGTRVPEGDYLAVIKSIKPDTSQNGNRMLVFTFLGKEGKLKGKEILDRATLTDKALFKLRDILEAVGIAVPRRVVNIPIKKLVGKEIGLTIVDDEPYNGRIKSTVADYISPDSIGEEDDEEDDDELEEEDDVEADEEEDDLDELDRAELKALIKEEELDVKVMKSMSDDDLREAINEAREEDEEEDDEEEEEAPAPKRKATAKKKPAAKAKAGTKRKKAKDDEDEEIEDIDLEDL